MPTPTRSSSSVMRERVPSPSGSTVTITRVNRALETARDEAARRIVFDNLRRELSRSAGHTSQLDVTRPDARRTRGLLARADDRVLPLAMSIELLDIRKHLV